MAARVIPRIVLALLSFAAIASHASGQIAYTVTDLGSGDAYAINASGQVVGQTGSDNAFLYSNGVMQNLGSGIALGINDSGHVVGQLNGQGFLYSNGSFQTIGGSGYEAVGINDNGQVVGTINSGSEAWIYTNGSIQDIGAGAGYPNATNVILQGGTPYPTDSEPASFHAYAIQWYQQTIGVNFLPWVGFQADITQGGLNGQQPAVGTYYIQNGNGVDLTPVFGGETGATVILAARDVTEGLEEVGSHVTGLTASSITSPIQTYNQCTVQTAVNTDTSGTLFQGIQITLAKQSNPQLMASAVRDPTKSNTLVVTDTQSASPTSSSFAWVPITIPPDDNALSLEFTCSGLSPDDFLSVGINNTLLFELENQFVTDGVATNSGFVDVSQWSGQDVQLFLGLNASDDNNLGGTIVVNDIEFASVPEPCSCQLTVVILFLIGHRRVYRCVFADRR
jgi:probable HAF family extracellular repeat protein